MALAGGAFLALWNDIARAREGEYDTWHTNEHVPERVAVDGFLGARRYVNRKRETHRYFTLYEVADLTAFDHAEYKDLVEHPTAWSASMRPAFTNFLRVTCLVEQSQGEGIGGALAILAFADARDDRPDILSLPGVTACHEGSPSPPVVADRFFDRILLIEALDREYAQHALSEVRRKLRLDSLPRDFGDDVYDLAFVYPGHDVAARVKHRRKHWSA